MVVVLVAHCVVGGTRPAQAACSPVVCLENISYLNSWKIEYPQLVDTMLNGVELFPAGPSN